ncbi:uncharacterized protein A1O5_08406 [Cladophialophora psammophila CBS 110553]|uniref:DUF676 domain-containing protein n=1 Tax=Cladophialophora psammophila CBS 110553 TaxID=1182543 RepID=W9WKC1_9EURO|nr:uncharacterized protein A1O5_08406 [Cladophialophora psammophila CBS 110553]EXJ68612.1 hypothetical protein A1O5_08406 [Cladophialophora psammophila CBS 110553]
MNFFRNFWRGTERASPQAGTNSANEEGHLCSSNNESAFEIFAEPEDAIVDIVLVHGLGGDVVDTWDHPLTNVVWPRDILPADVPDARIMSFRYDSKFVRSFGPVSSNTIRDHGRVLAGALDSTRDVAGYPTRPIIFIAHSLGGLVCEYAILLSEKDYLANSTIGIITLGTPHEGSNLANWSKILSGIAKVFPASNKIVDALRPCSEELGSLQDDFFLMLRRRRQRREPVPDIVCFYEELEMNRALGLIVTKRSATLSSYRKYSLHGNHVSMVKFSGRSDAGYQAIMREIKMWVKEIEGKKTGSQAVGSGRDIEPHGMQHGKTFRNYYAGNVTHSGQVFQGDITSSSTINISALPK